jgi:hypothetical protein
MSAFVVGSLLASAGSQAIGDPVRFAVLGVSLGMTVNQVDRLIASLPGIESKESSARKAPEGKRAAARKRTLVRFADGTFLRIEYRVVDGIEHVSVISLVYQGHGYSKETIGRVLTKYGTPDYTGTQDSMQQYAWGGKHVSEVAVEPSDKVGATLLVQHLLGEYVSLELATVVR